MTDKKTNLAATPKPRKKGRLGYFGPVMATFTITTAALIIAVYRFGEGAIYINGKTISDFNFLEVTFGTVAGMLGAILGLGAAAVGTAGALMATVAALCVAAFGLAFGAVVVIGVVTGPILLMTIIAILIKRRYWPDVI